MEPRQNQIGSTDYSSQNKREQDGSLYPDIDDEAFLQKLLKKREFRETLQDKITDATLKDNVCNVNEFEYTSAQKFVSQFMSPNTPYNGMLLYHGVGVGKTCSAILVAESFLQLSPKNKVYILAPPAIQAGFYRTIFDSSRIRFGKESDEQNQHDGCTGNRYLEMTQTLYEREKKDIETRVNRLINKRYSIMGYVSFRNMIRDILNQIPSTLKPERKLQQKTILLQRALSGCLIIVDEAHNLRDVAEADDDDADLPETMGDSSAGKKLAPFLKEILKTCDGNKLMLMSATPMYNSYREIISLLNLLLYVDHVDDSELLKDSDIKFITNAEGEEQLTEESENKLIKIANGRVSFMRGENPKAFPARLDPIVEEKAVWPSLPPDGGESISKAEKDDVLRLPIIQCNLEGETLGVIQHMTETLIASKGIGIRTIDPILQAGNCVFPGEGLDGRVGSEGFQTWFTPRAISASFEGTRLSTLPQYQPAMEEESYSWMVNSADGLGKVSPKFNKVLDSIRSSTGISFVYSRFVENGAVIFCLLLEANGFTPWGRSAPLFSKGSLSGGRQCCKCSRKEIGHPAFNAGQPESKKNHKFAPAYYALLTASDVNTVEKQSLPLSPNNTGVVNVARDVSNKDGGRIKVVVGSQVAGEGLDLRAIREVHILEGWFHLSKQEQIVGRGIRYCSHNALSRENRNCTIYLYVNSFPAEVNKETIDQYTYRTAMNKAVRIGNISRALKRGAADCNLNRDAILIRGLSDVDMVDSQDRPRSVEIKDRDYTPTCDWIRCSYTCKPTLDLLNKVELPEDNSTYDMFSARFAEQMLLHKLRAVFKEQPWFHWTKLQEMFNDIPKETLTGLMLRVINNQSIIFENGNLKGHIIYRNDLFLFQPNKIQDPAIPIAFRYGKYPMKRDSYVPEMKEARKEIRVPATSLPQANMPTDKDIATVFWNRATQWINIMFDREFLLWPRPENVSKGLLEQTFETLGFTTKQQLSSNISDVELEGTINSMRDDIQYLNNKLNELKSEKPRKEEYDKLKEECFNLKSECILKIQDIFQILISKGYPVRTKELMVESEKTRDKYEKNNNEYDKHDQEYIRLVKETFMVDEAIELIQQSSWNKLSSDMLTYVENDFKTLENFQTRIKQLEWWATYVREVPDGLADLRSMARQYIWDSFLKGPQQVDMLEKNIPYSSEASGLEQYIKLSDTKTVWRYLDTTTREPVYICEGQTVCPPSIVKVITSSKTDPVVNARSSRNLTAEIYGFMVVWEKAIMFKTNEPPPDGKDPGQGAACAIVSTVKGHRMKLVDIGNVLHRFLKDEGRFGLTESNLSSGPRKLQGAPAFCALMEIVLRWMDLRRSQYGGLRYFYRPLSSYYSKHKSKRA